MKMLSTPCIKDYFKEEQSKSNMCKVPREMLFTSLQKGIDFFFFCFFCGIFEARMQPWMGKWETGEECIWVGWFELWIDCMGRKEEVRVISY